MDIEILEPSTRPDALPPRSFFSQAPAMLFACMPEIVGMRFAYRRDEEIYGEGEDTEFLYKVVSGAVRTYKIMRDGRRQIGGFHLPGDYFGLELGRGHLLTAEATTDSKVLLFKRCRIEAVAMRDIGAARELWHMTAGQLRHAEDHMLLLGRKTAIERLAAFLLEMDARLGRTGIIELPMSRRDIADYLGLTLETVSRGFSQFHASGIVQLIDARHVVLLERRKLEDAAG
jgi:CRP/FNR family nitrogen fixation transcriptional regulator